MEIISYLQKRTPFLNNKYYVSVISVLICCFITILNKYPILYSDTSTYISSGFELETPFDRPIVYGILLRIFSLNGLSFIFVPIFQAFLYIYILFNVLKIFLKKENVSIEVLCLSSLLSIATGFNWSINQLIPDFLTSVGFLSLVCVFFNNKKFSKNIPLFLVLFISSSSHISHLFLFLALLIIILLGRKRYLSHLNLKLLKANLASVFVLLLLSYVIMASAISKSKDIFFAGSLAQKGILETVLKDKCSERQFKLCAYKDSIPKSFEGFVWKPESPLYKAGGWKELRKELSEIKTISLTEGKFLSVQIKYTLRYFFSQLIMFQIGDGNGSFNSETLLSQRIKKYTLFDEELVKKSKQHEGSFVNLNLINLYYSIVSAFSFLLLILLLFYNRKKLNEEMKFFIILTFALILFSAFLIAFSSEIANRHGCKLIWLITLINYVLIAKYMYKKNMVCDN